MERLTRRSVNGTAIYNTPSGNPVEWENNRHRVLQKLAEYEDLEQQGLLLKLPCKVGDTVYAYCGEFGILPYEVDCIVIDKKIIFQCSSYSEPIGDCPSECLDEIEPHISDFGKTVFLTQAEAEGAFVIGYKFTKEQIKTLETLKRERLYLGEIPNKR